MAYSFTPGPWQGESDGDANNRTFYVTDHTGLEVICQCETTITGTHGRAKENARLIQAAPDLLIALELLLKKAPAGAYGDKIRKMAERAATKARKGPLL